MREILFRGQIVNGEWVYGLLCHDKDSHNKDFEWFISNRAGKPYAFGIIPKTIGQFTGLYDKNGVKIFEGDIVEVKIKHRNYDEDETDFTIAKTVIEYSRGGFCYRGSGYTDCNWHFYNAEDLKVIGNIHDNPELLEGV